MSLTKGSRSPSITALTCHKSKWSPAVLHGEAGRHSPSPERTQAHSRQIWNTLRAQRVSQMFLQFPFCAQVSSRGSGSSPPPLNSLPSPLSPPSHPRLLAQGTYSVSMVARLTNLIAQGFKFFRLEQPQDRQSSLLPILMTSRSITLILRYALSSPLHQKKG